MSTANGAPSADGIYWVLTPTPAWGRTAWAATSTCRHGQQAFILFGRVDVVKQAAQDMAAPHRMQTRCHCVTQEIVIKDRGEGDQ